MAFEKVNLFINFALIDDVPTLKKVEVRTSQSIVVKSEMGGEEIVQNFDLSGMSPYVGEQIKRPYSDILYDANVDTNENLNIYIVGQGNLPAIETVIETFSAYPYLAEGETDIPEEESVKPEWLPVEKTESEVVAYNVIQWKTRVGQAADKFAAGLSKLTTNSSLENTIKHFESWIGAAWNEIERYATNHAEKLPESVLLDLIVKCEELIEIGGVKHWHYHANENAVIWRDKLDNHQIWTTNEEDGTPDMDWRVYQELPNFTAAEFNELRETCYEKAQAYSVGVEL